MFPFPWARPALPTTAGQIRESAVVGVIVHPPRAIQFSFISILDWIILFLRKALTWPSSPPANSEKSFSNHFKDYGLHKSIYLTEILVSLFLRRIPRPKFNPSLMMSLVKFCALHSHAHARARTKPLSTQLQSLQLKSLNLVIPQCTTLTPHTRGGFT